MHGCSGLMRRGELTDKHYLVKDEITRNCEEVTKDTIYQSRTQVFVQLFGFRLITKGLLYLTFVRIV